MSEPLLATAYKCPRCRWRGRIRADVRSLLGPRCPVCVNVVRVDLDRAAQDACDRVFPRTLASRTSGATPK